MLCKENRTCRFNVGPKPKTVVDFWRMAWENESGKIIMLTNLMELGKVKFLLSSLVLIYSICIVRMSVSPRPV